MAPRTLLSAHSVQNITSVTPKLDLVRSCYRLTEGAHSVWKWPPTYSNWSGVFARCDIRDCFWILGTPPWRSFDKFLRIRMLRSINHLFCRPGFYHIALGYNSDSVRHMFHDP